jgi:hypothetical protein
LDFEVKGVFARFLSRHLDVQTGLFLAPIQPPSAQQADFGNLFICARAQTFNHCITLRPTQCYRVQG